MKKRAFKMIVGCGLVTTVLGTAVFADPGPPLPPPPPGNGPDAVLENAGADLSAQPMPGRGPQSPRSRRDMATGRRDRPVKQLSGADVEQWFDRLKEEEPEEFERLTALRRENPEQFRQEIRKRVTDRVRERRAEQVGPEEQECLELSGKYRETADPAAKQEIKDRIRETVRVAFDKRLERTEKWLDFTEKRLAKARADHEFQQQNRDKICENRVEELTADPRLNWQGR